MLLKNNRILEIPNKPTVKNTSKAVLSNGHGTTCAFV
jgi:hypothetical protein